MTAGCCHRRPNCCYCDYYYHYYYYHSPAPYPAAVDLPTTVLLRNLWSVAEIMCLLRPPRSRHRC